MSLLNNKDKGGNSSKFSWNHSVLKGLQSVSDNTAGVTGLLSAIATLIAAQSEDVEFQLVKDITNDKIVVQVREFDTGTDLWVFYYQNIDGSDYVPTPNPSPTYEAIDNTAANGVDGVAHGTLQVGTRVLGTDGLLDQQIKVDANGKIEIENLDVALTTLLNTLGQKGSTASAPVVLSTEQEVILQAIADNNTPKTPTSVNTSIAGTVASGASEISFFNNGSADATVNGTPLPPGVTRTFGFKNDILVAIAYDGNGEQLLIDYMF